MMKRKNALLYVFLFLIVCSGVLFSQDMDPEAGKLYNEGNKLLKAGNYDGALEQYNQALNIEKDFRIFYQRGIALKKLGNHEEAKNSFEECIKLKPDFEGGYNALGGVYFSMGNYQKAVDNFEKVLEISQSNNVKNKVKKNLSLAYTKLGNEAIKDGNSNKAVEYLTKGAETSNYDAAYLSLSKLYSELGEWDKAISAGESALKYRSSVGKGGPYYYMGIAYKGKGDLTKAKEMFQQARTDATYRKTADYELSILQ
jgi:tetratricopeptide (TPR) repeat protein